MSFTVLIPARLASTRLPNKPLADRGGAPMIVRVAQRALMCSVEAAAPVRVVVAGDSPEIMAACQAHHIEAVLTRSDHLSGSDRLAEACDILKLTDDEIVVNVQGDEPLMDPKLILAVANLLRERPEASLSTAAHAIETLADFNNPNIVKVVLDARALALYFSRSPIPMARDFDGQAWWQGDPGPRASTSAAPGPAAPQTNTALALVRSAGPLRHIGIYGYRVSFLRLFPTLAQAPIEVAEALEQLRAMWHGHRIAVHVTPDAPGPGVDTPGDLARVRKFFTA